MTCQAGNPGSYSQWVNFLLSKIVILLIMPAPPTPQHCSEDQKNKDMWECFVNYKVPYKYELLLFPAGVVWDYFNEGIINDW